MAQNNIQKSDSRKPIHAKTNPREQLRCLSIRENQSTRKPILITKTYPDNENLSWWRKPILMAKAYPDSESLSW